MKVYFVTRLFLIENHGTIPKGIFFKWKCLDNRTTLPTNVSVPRNTKEGVSPSGEKSI